jgi:hypothetical protein
MSNFFVSSLTSIKVNNYVQLRKKLSDFCGKKIF